MGKSKKQTDAEIKKWIDGQLSGCSITVVLVGSNTCKSKWVKYEIEKSIELSKGLLEIDISKIKTKMEKHRQKVIGCCLPHIRITDGIRMMDITTWGIGLKLQQKPQVGNLSVYLKNMCVA